MLSLNMGQQTSIFAMGTNEYPLPLKVSQNTSYYMDESAGGQDAMSGFRERKGSLFEYIINPLLTQIIQCGRLFILASFFPSF